MYKNILSYRFSEIELTFTSIIHNYDNSEEILMPYYIISAELKKEQPNFIQLINVVDSLIENLSGICSKDELIIIESLKTFIGKNAFGLGYIKKEVHDIIYL